MDPKATLAEIRKLYEDIGSFDDQDVEVPEDLAIDLAEKVSSLDDWMRSGGFSPWS